MQDWIKRRVATAASRAGYEIVPAWKFDRQPLVRHLRKLFELQRIDAVLDVGGNLGQYRDVLRDDVGFTGWILTFEPVAMYIAHLRLRAAGDPRWRIYPYALGSENKKATIHVTRSPGLNSFLDPRTDAFEGYWTPGEVVSEEEVLIQKLDDVYESMQREFAITSPYLKLDTQGFDLEVLKGAEKVMPQFNALQSEASVIPIYQGMPSHLDTISAMTALGLQLSGMFPVKCDDALRLVEYDCVFLR